MLIQLEQLKTKTKRAYAASGRDLILDVLGRSKDGSTERSALIGGSVKMVEDDLLQVGLHFLHLTQNNSAFSFNLFFPKVAVLDDIR